MMVGRFALLLMPVILLPACQTLGDVELPYLTNSSVSDEQEIARILDDVQRGMETKRIYKVLAHVSRNYQDAEGRDYDDIVAYLQAIFKRYRDIQITRIPPKVLVQGDRARAIETFGTIANSQDASADIPIHLQGQVRVYFEKAGDRWLITEWGVLR